MSSGGSVLAVVDSVDDVPIVWWVDLGPRVAGMSRLCGAWALDSAERQTTLRTLIATRTTVCTAAGQSMLDKLELSADRVLDIEATLAAVIAARDELQSAYEKAAATRKTLVPPRWPALPEPLDVETAHATADDPRTSRALGIARWFNDLCIAWDGVEEQRLARPYMRSLGGSAARPLPAVTRDALSSTALI